MYEMITAAINIIITTILFRMETPLFVLLLDGIDMGSSMIQPLMIEKSVWNYCYLMELKLT